MSRANNPKRGTRIKTQLNEGKCVAYRQSGWSLYPRIHSNDLTTAKEGGNHRYKDVIHLNTEARGLELTPLSDNKSQRRGVCLRQTRDPSRQLLAGYTAHERVG